VIEARLSRTNSELLGWEKLHCEVMVTDSYDSAMKVLSKFRNVKHDKTKSVSPFGHLYLC
jgi:hypothetical protein